MALVSLNLQPTKKALRQFALAAMIMCALSALILLWSHKISPPGFGIIISLGVIIFVAGIISAKSIKPIYLTLIILTFPIGWLISHLVMAVFYYGVITPVAIVFKIIGRDPLNRKYDRQTKTYWLEHRQNRPVKDYFHQF